MAKRKTGERFACGKLKQPNAQQRAEIEARLARQQTEYVKAQPHRRDAEDPAHEWNESALGRFCKFHKRRPELYAAGLKWAELHRLFNVAWGAPVDEHHGGGGNGLGPSMETQEKWKLQMRKIEEKLLGIHEEDEAKGPVTHMNKARLKVVNMLCLDDKPVPRELAEHALEGLRILAIEFGQMSAKDAPHHSEAA
jgi:hypothetical protein